MTTSSRAAETPSAVGPPTGTAASAEAGKARTRQGRYQFLDALRGIAAMAVVLQHGAEQIWPAYMKFSIEVFRPGEFGVILFFLISGFIIPASLEKYNSLRKFWIGRFFRLFPAYWFFVIAALVLHYAFDRYGLPEEYLAQPLKQTVSNLTMMQFFLDESRIIGASWTLAYEMTFYILVSLLFLAGLSKRSVPTAALMLGIAVAVGTSVPNFLVTRAESLPGSWITVAAVTCAVAAFFAWRASGRMRPIAVALSLVLIPPLLNQPERLWFSLLLLSTMFVGTVMFRVTSGEVPASTGWLIFGAALAVIVVLHRWHVEPHIEPTAGAFVTYKPEVLAFAAAYGVFALALLLRQRRFPMPLVFLGRISYSLYLVHTLVLYSVPWWSESAANGIGVPNTVLTYVTWMSLTVLVSVLTFYGVEKPFQDLGHRITKPKTAATRAMSAQAT